MRRFWAKGRSTTMEKYKVTLTVEERQALDRMVSSGKAARGLGGHRGPVVRQDGAGAAGGRPEALPGAAAGHEEVRAAVQGSDGGGASQRPLEDLLGSGRWGSDRSAAILRAAGGRGA